MQLAINTNASIKVISVGNKNTPVIIFDDFILNRAALVSQINTDVRFETVKDSYYPGIRAKLPNEYVIPTLQAVYQKICHVYNIPIELQLTPQDLYYSLITTQEKDLHLLQRIPHYDSTAPYYFAALHYLADGEHGNTGLFSHKPTGFERITERNSQQYLKQAQLFIEKNGEPNSEYCKASTDHYQLFHEIEYKPNRLVIYPGWLLHSTLVNVEQDISSQPLKGRLTANMFINFC